MFEVLNICSSNCYVSDDDNTAASVSANYNSSVPSASLVEVEGEAKEVGAVKVLIPLFRLERVLFIRARLTDIFERKTNKHAVISTNTLNKTNSRSEN